MTGLKRRKFGLAADARTFSIVLIRVSAAAAIFRDGFAGVLLFGGIPRVVLQRVRKLLKILGLRRGDFKECGRC
jgi:hypothetical protein